MTREQMDVGYAIRLAQIQMADGDLSQDTRDLLQRLTDQAIIDLDNDLYEDLSACLGEVAKYDRKDGLSDDLAQQVYATALAELEADGVISSETVDRLETEQTRAYVCGRDADVDKIDDLLEEDYNNRTKGDR